jgi:predicted transcriptional regulator
MVALTRKQKEALVISLHENGKTYKEIAQELKISPNSIKAILTKAGLDQSTTKSSVAFELFSKDKTPLEVAITLDLEADEAIRLHQLYFKLLGCTEFTRVYQEIKDNPWLYVNLVKLAQDEGISEDQIIKLLEIANGHLPRVTAEYEKVKTEINSLENEKSNSAKDYQRLCDGIIRMNKRTDQLQMNVLELEDQKAILELQKTGLKNFIKNFQDKDIEYHKVRQGIQGEIENVLADRRHLLRLAVRSTIELLRVDPQKFHSFYYNQSTIQPESGEEPILVEAEELYKKMLENITNKVVTNLSDNVIYTSSFAQKESSEQNSDDMRTFAKEERTLSDPEDNGIEGNSIKEHPDMPAGHRMIFFPHRGQAWHPNFDTESEP